MVVGKEKGGVWLMNDFAFMHLPDGRALLGHGPFRRAAEAPESEFAFYRNDFGLGDPMPWWIPNRVEFLSAVELREKLGGELPPVCEWFTPEASDFAAIFHEITTEIRGGAFEKTVPVVVERGRFAALPGKSMAAAAAACAPPHAAYGFVEGERGFAGTSPEMLLSVRGRHLETMALAGTARVEEREVLEVDDKEIREHEYVVQALVSKLGDLGDVRRESRGIMELGSIVHFHTPIHVDLFRDEGPDALIRRLHPTPALGPLPRTAGTMARLLDWRERLGVPGGFGAPFGALVDGTFFALVAIRGMWWEGIDVSLPAGVGVIEASRLVNEWRELRLKREAVKARFGL